MNGASQVCACLASVACSIEGTVEVETLFNRLAHWQLSYPDVIFFPECF